MSETSTTVQELQEMHKLLDETLTAMKHFPCGGLYEAVCRQKAMLLQEEGKESEAVAYLTESFGVTVRLKFISQFAAHKAAKTDKPKFPHPQLQKDLIQFGASFAPDAPLGYIKRLKALPSDWTVVQICELDWRPSQCPPRCIVSKDRKPLAICHLGCGELAGTQVLRLVPKPTNLPYNNNNVISELKEVIERFDSMTEKHCKGPPHLYFSERQALGERFKVVLAALQDWLAENRCLLLGRLVHPDLAAAVKKAVSKLASTLKVPDSSANFLDLLAQGSAVLSDEELAAGLRSILPVHCSSPKQLRTAVDSVRALAKSVTDDNSENLTQANRHPIILILDRELYGVPWEMLDILQTQSATRMPGLAVAHALHMDHGTLREVDSRSTFFVVDPDSNLKSCAQRVGPIVKAHPSWRGTVSELPDQQELALALQNNDIYLYCGHGGGMHILTNHDSLHCNSVAILMGCSSSKQDQHGMFWEAHGPSLNFILGGSPMTLGTLWNVLDSDTNRITVHLLESWLPPSKDKKRIYHKQLLEKDISYKDVLLSARPCKELLTALRAARKVSKLEYIAAAFVVTGLPTTARYTTP